MTIEETISEAWFNLLNGNVTGFNVYRTNAPTGFRGNYVLIRKETQVPQWNKSGFFRNVTIIIEIVTRDGVIINDKLVDDADDQIRSLVFSGVYNNLGVGEVIKIDGGVSRYLDEDDGTQKIYRKITRFTHYTNN